MSKFELQAVPEAKTTADTTTTKADTTADTVKLVEYRRGERFR